jgi:PLP dependent protein
MTNIAENLAKIRERIGKAAIRSGRDPKEIKLVGATKGVPPELIEEAIKAGLRDIGENRVQEAASKIDAIQNYPINWHMIGHLQTNKVKQALEIFSVIQSVDSERLAKEISARAVKPVEVFMEVNTSGEASKYGVSPESAPGLATYICKHSNLKLTGLMTIGPNTDVEDDRRKSFKMLKDLFNRIKGLNLPSLELEYLSMGMSDDFEIAIEEGSNLVRIGRAIFGVEHKLAQP